MKAPLFKRAARVWNNWWFGPISPGPLGLFRIALGTLVLAYALLLWPWRFLWFSEHGALTTADVDRFNGIYAGLPRIDFLHGVTGNRWVTILLAVLIVAAALLAIGLATRAASIVVFLLLATLHNRDVMILNSADTVMMIMSAYLVLAPAGAACSIDRLLRVRRGLEGRTPPNIAPWAQRLMQLQVAAIYCSATFAKWPGDTWRNGTAVYYAYALPDIQRFPVPWIDAHHIWFVHLLTWGAMTIELSLWTLIWVPRARLYVLAVGAALHLGIEYALNVPMFAFVMVVSYIVFLRTADLQNFARWIGRRKAVETRQMIEPSVT